jgi:hypothetical protein
MRAGAEAGVFVGDNQRCMQATAKGNRAKIAEMYKSWPFFKARSRLAVPHAAQLLAAANSVRCAASAAPRLMCLFQLCIEADSMNVTWHIV